MKRIKEFFKNTKINGFLIGDICLSVLFVCILFVLIPFTRKYISAKYIIVLSGSVFISWFLALYGGKSFLKNKSNKTVYAKCENDSTVFEIEKGESKSNIDGIKVDDVVYKVSDGAKVTVDKNGKVSFGSFLLASLTKCGVLNECPGEEWKPIFNK